MKMIDTHHSAAPVWTTGRVRVAPVVSTVQGTGVPFAGYTATPDMTLVAARNAGSRAPARGRPL